jgi:hypothetical protein
MKKLSCILLFLFSVAFAKAQRNDLHALFKLSDAEKVMGETATQLDSSAERGKGVLLISRSFAANKEETGTHKRGKIYFLMEVYDQLNAAKQKYTFIKKANAGHEGVETLANLGHEAYFHSDGKNFYFIMVRKGNYVFNIKVNKITRNTSKGEFLLLARRIVDQL